MLNENTDLPWTTNPVCFLLNGSCWFGPALHNTRPETCLIKSAKESILFEEVSVQRSVWGGLHGHLQHLHALLQSGVSCSKPRGFKSLEAEEETRNQYGNEPWGPWTEARYLWSDKEAILLTCAAVFRRYCKIFSPERLTVVNLCAGIFSWPSAMV